LHNKKQGILSSGSPHFCIPASLTSYTYVCKANTCTQLQQIAKAMKFLCQLLLGLNIEPHNKDAALC